MAQLASAISANDNACVFVAICGRQRWLERLGDGRLGHARHAHRGGDVPRDNHPPIPHFFFILVQLLLSTRCIGSFPVASIVAFDLKPFSRLNSLEWEAAAAAEADHILQQSGKSAKPFTPAAAASAASKQPAFACIVGDIRIRCLPSCPLPSIIVTYFQLRHCTRPAPAPRRRHPHRLCRRLW